MPEKEDSKSELEEALDAVVEKGKEFKLASFRFQRVAQRVIDRINEELEEITPETPRIKARDKAKKLTEDVYEINEFIEKGLIVCYRVDSGVKDLKERAQAYTWNKTRDQKEKGGIQ